MVYRGHVRDGRIELDEPIRLPEGATVKVSVVSDRGPSMADKDENGLTLYDSLKALIGTVDDLPSDASINVDHYLYGHPKR